MNIYLIKSNSLKLINDELNNILTPDSLIINMDLSQNTISDLIEEAATFSLFNEKKFIIARNIHLILNKLNDSDLNLFKRYLELPNEQTVLVMLADSQLKEEDNEIIKIIKKRYQYLFLKNLNVTQIFNKIEIYLKENNLIMNRETIYYLINNSLNNYDLVFNELNKIQIYYFNESKRQVNMEDLKNIMYTSTDNNIYRFISDVTNKIIIDALEKLQVLKIYKVEPVIIFTALAKDYRNLYNLKNMQLRKKLDQEKKNFKLEEWQINKLLDASYKYQLFELENILLKIGSLDEQYKAGQIDGYLGLEFFLLQL